MTKNTLRKTVAVTGATGFLGNELIEELGNHNIAYTLFDRKKHNLLEPETLKDFVSKKDIIIHLAGVNRDNNLNLIKVNTLGTLGLLEAIAKYSPKARIIFASSFQVYLKNSLYGLSKKLAESLIEFYVNKYPLKATIFRMSNIYGPGCRPFYNSVIATFAYQITHNDSITINGDGKQKRDYVYVGDAVKAIIKTIFYRPKNKFESFDICSGKKTALKEIVEILQKIHQKPIKINYNQEVKDQWPRLDKNYQKAKETLSWEPRIDLMTGLKQTIKSFYENRS